jgi:hypothetical protein
MRGTEKRSKVYNFGVVVRLVQSDKKEGGIISWD